MQNTPRLSGTVADLELCHGRLGWDRSAPGLMVIHLGGQYPLRGLTGVRLRPASSAPVVPDQPGRPGPAGSEPVRMPGAAGIQCPQQLAEARDPQLANHDPARRRAHVGQGGEAHPPVRPETAISAQAFPPLAERRW